MLRALILILFFLAVFVLEVFFVLVRRGLLDSHGLPLHASLMSLLMTAADLVLCIQLNLRTVLEFIVHALVDYPSGKFGTDKFVVVAVCYQIAHDEQVLEDVVVPSDYQVVNLGGSATRESQDLVVVTRDNKGLHSRGYLYLVIVPIDREVFNVVSHSFVLVVTIQRIRLV
jgi:hypothetical protein